jgi:hypothetical protein
MFRIPFTSFTTRLPFCIFVFDEHTAPFAAMLDANVERERRNRGLGVITEEEDCRRKRELRLVTADKNIHVSSGKTHSFLISKTDEIQYNN